MDLVPDLPGSDWVCRVARALAPLRDALPPSTSAELPVSVRLLDLVGGVDAAGVEAHWSSTGSSTTAVIGVTAAGPVAVDLAVDGPHALVAGTTGAGKSELLQTLVCSLALANRPDELTFLLVDYKGGAAFRGCARLPHVVGVVTDLDGHLTTRALTSLTAELRRRERLLAAEGVSSLEAYQRLRTGKPELPVVPRLVIVIDEFRVLAEELPDFVHGLVRLAAVGRSLGVHLVLATQRPGGIVSADIRANVSLRIALRVRDRTDSIDVLDAPDAASIDASTPGRASLRGATTPLTPFQSARVTGGPDGAAGLTLTSVPEPARRLDRASGDEQRREDDQRRIGSRPHRLGHSRGGSIPRRPGSALPVARPAAGPARRVVLGDGRGGRDPTCPAGAGGRPGRPGPDARGRGTSPAATSGSPAAAAAVGPRPCSSSPPSWPDAGHPAPCTCMRSARPSWPRSRHFRTWPPSPTSTTPTTCDLVVERLAHVTSGNPDSTSRPVLLVDGWERLAAHAHGSLAADVRATLEAAGRSGLRAVVTGGRAVLAGQLVPLFAQRLVLALGDPVDMAVAGIPPRVVPTHQPPGRALDARTHRQVQIARLRGEAGG